MHGLFDEEYSPRKIRFLLAHWLELASMAERRDSRSVANVAERLKSEWGRLPPHQVCLCGTVEEPPDVPAGSGQSSGRGLSEVMPDIEGAYQELPLHWRGRTEVYLLMLGHRLEEIEEMRWRRVAEQLTEFELRHRQRLRSELLAGKRPRPEDVGPETSPWPRMARYLGWAADETVVVSS